ncbi:MAG: septal ring lytic transglycosylase RlpA family protein [Phaeodactylibacter sp.]|nr:septal ring lytic transglycosylase RlpA family protein [Phaeodactylibacter sp.]
MKKIMVILCTVLGLTAMLQAQTPPTGTSQYGEAVFYADYLHGKPTALGEYYDKFELTCAHRTHPLGTLLKVTRQDNGQSVTVRVNDRGPFVDGCPQCIIDLSWAAADLIGLSIAGKASVQLDVVGFANSNPASPYAKYRNGTSTATTTLPKEYAAESGPIRMSTTMVPKTSEIPTSYGETSAAIASPAGIQRMPDGQTGYGVQVASYGNYSNAQRQIQSMQQRGVQNIYLKEARQYDGSVLYRVIVGIHQNRASAATLMQDLKMRHQVSGFVVNLSN